jgi:hypothetical protein
VADVLPVAMAEGAIPFTEDAKWAAACVRAVKAYEGSRVIDQLILNLGTEWSDSRSDRLIFWKISSGAR